MSIVSTGGIVAEVLQAADQLAAEGISCEVFSVHTLKPFDGQSIIESVRRTGRLLIVEEHVLEGGLGGAVAEAMLDAGCPLPASRRLGLTGGFSTVVGSQNFLRAEYGMDIRAMTQASRELMGAAG